MKLGETNIFIGLCILFLLYSFTIYLRPIAEKKPNVFNREQAASGKLVWQKYNCQSCHQLYGLGGYLGPDLTNIYSDKNKGEQVIESVVKYGTKQMQAFDLPENEKNDLLEFLKSVDASGTADPRSFTKDKFGMIHQNEN